MADYRNVWALIAAVTFLQIGGGILGVVTPLGLNALGAGTLIIGIVAGLNAIGYMVGAWYVASAIRVFRAISITVLVMNIALNTWAWAAVRLVQGAGLAMMFSSIESWLGAAVPAKSRGGVSGFYHVMAKAALIIGPFFVAGLAAIDPHPYMWGAIFISLSLLPICLTRRNEPPAPDTEPLSLRELYKLAPAGVVGVFMAGLINTGTLSLLPIYAKSALADMGGAPTALAAAAAAAAWGGGLVTQWPAGRLSDKFDRRLVIAVMALASSLAALLLGLGGLLPPIIILLLLAVWGGGSLSFYGIAVAHTIDWTPTGKIAQAMAGLLFIWAVGAVLGPLLSGSVMMLAIGSRGLFLLAAALGLLLVLAMIWRRVSRATPPAESQEPWNPTTPLLVGKGEVDPRVE